MVHSQLVSRYFGTGRWSRATERGTAADSHSVARLGTGRAICPAGAKTLASPK